MAFRSSSSMFPRKKTMLKQVTRSASTSHMSDVYRRLNFSSDSMESTTDSSVSAALDVAVHAPLSEDNIPIGNLRVQSMTASQSSLSEEDANFDAAMNEAIMLPSCPIFTPINTPAQSCLLARYAQQESLEVEKTPEVLELLTIDIIRNIADKLNVPCDEIVYTLQAPKANWLLRESKVEGMVTVEYYGHIGMREGMQVQSIILGQIHETHQDPNSSQHYYHMRYALVENIQNNTRRWVVVNDDAQRHINDIVWVTTHCFSNPHHVIHSEYPIFLQRLQDRGFTTNSQLTPRRVAITTAIQAELNLLLCEKQHQTPIRLSK